MATVLLCDRVVMVTVLLCDAEFRLALVQLHVSKVKADNLSRARKLVKEAASQGAKMVVLPVSNVSIVPYLLSHTNRANWGRELLKMMEY